MIRILFLAAIGMAAFLDFSTGALIVFTLGLASGVNVPLWQVGVGGVLALLPDFDILTQALASRLMDRHSTGDHRATVMHAPLIMLPACTFLGWFFRGPFWATATFLCLLYHYVHDSRVFSVGDIDWLWPLTNRKLPWMDTKEWLQKYWLHPTKTSVTECFVGVVLIGWVATTYFELSVAMILVLLIVFINITTWTIYRYVD